MPAINTYQERRGRGEEGGREGGSGRQLKDPCPYNTTIVPNMLLASEDIKQKQKEQHHNFLTTKNYTEVDSNREETRDEKTCPSAWQSEPSTPPSVRIVGVCTHTHTYTLVHTASPQRPKRCLSLVQQRWRITGHARWHWSTGLSAPVDSLTRSSPWTFFHNCFTLCFTRRLDPFCRMSLVSFCVCVSSSFFFLSSSSSYSLCVWFGGCMCVTFCCCDFSALWWCDSLWVVTLVTRVVLRSVASEIGWTLQLWSVFFFFSFSLSSLCFKLLLFSPCLFLYTFLSASWIVSKTLLWLSICVWPPWWPCFVDWLGSTPQCRPGRPCQCWSVPVAHPLCLSFSLCDFFLTFCTLVSVLWLVSTPPCDVLYSLGTILSTAVCCWLFRMKAMPAGPQGQCWSVFPPSTPFSLCDLEQGNFLYVCKCFVNCSYIAWPPCWLCVVDSFRPRQRRPGLSC